MITLDESPFGSPVALDSWILLGSPNLEFCVTVTVNEWQSSCDCLVTRLTPLERLESLMQPLDHFHFIGAFTQSDLY